MFRRVVKNDFVWDPSEEGVSPLPAWPFAEHDVAAVAFKTGGDETHFETHESLDLVNVDDGEEGDGWAAVAHLGAREEATIVREGFGVEGRRELFWQ